MSNAVIDAVIGVCREKAHSLPARRKEIESATREAVHAYQKYKNDLDQLRELAEWLDDKCPTDVPWVKMLASERDRSDLKTGGMEEFEIALAIKDRVTEAYELWTNAFPIEDPNHEVPDQIYERLEEFDIAMMDLVKSL